LYVGAGRDFAAGLEVVVDERDGEGDPEERDGDGDGRARSEELTGAIDENMDVTEDEKEGRNGEAL
jgi:hypothetical protein